MKRYATLILFLMPAYLQADQSFYCPQKSMTISVGMTADQVLNACGAPLSKTESEQPATVKVPVTNLIYNNLGTDKMYSIMSDDPAVFGEWNIPTGSGGTQLEVNIVNNKVKNVKVDGSNANSVSMCNGASIQEGDDVSKVYNECGSPSMVNNTFIEQVINSPNPPEIWIYQPSQYAPKVTLTFVEGKLQSIR